MAEMSTNGAATMTTPRDSLYGRKALAWVAMLVAGVTTAYWVTWFIIPGGRDFLAVMPTNPSYISFENAFPVADGWMALCGLISAIQLFRGKSSAIPWLMMAGSAGMYLGGMDILYDLENGVYQLVTQNPGSVGTEMGINVATVAISVVTLAWAWRHRAWQKDDLTAKGA